MQKRQRAANKAAIIGLTAGFAHRAWVHRRSTFSEKRRRLILMEIFLIFNLSVGRRSDKIDNMFDCLREVNSGGTLTTGTGVDFCG